MNIFVAKLNFNTQEDLLREAFEAYGEVESVKIIMDKFTGRSKGFGFVEMPNEEEGIAAIEALNNSELDGREIVAKKSEPRENNRGGGGGRGGYGGGRDRGGYGGGGDRGGYGGGRDRGGWRRPWWIRWRWRSLLDPTLIDNNQKALQTSV